MPTQNVNITDAQSEFIRQCVEFGDYNNASEFIRESLRLLKAQKDEQQTNLDWVRAELQKGYDARDAGRYVDLSTKAQRKEFFEGVNRRGLERFMEGTKGAATSPE